MLTTQLGRFSTVSAWSDFHQPNTLTILTVHHQSSTVHQQTLQAAYNDLMISH